ncbi:C3a anaphylatoxin chemotactic receptor-like [Scomber japonicus]|uniref:C3a anaphylatoxin chemotactic receptor-like n=1 Tax=Scomber japonicus TaxID=13676 RepID=UPI002306538F|nr:C3a anaphylatoxin chemotactic receptor-like [Scomber japonicus]
MMEMTATPSYHTNTTGVSGGDEYADLRRSLDIMSAVICCLTFVLGVLGNGVVIWVTGFKMKKTVNTVWFLNLAVADFLFTAFLPFMGTWIALDYHWPFGTFMCRLNNTVWFVNMFTSAYILVVISMDRYVSVVWPVWARNHRNVCKASYVSLGVWVLGLFLSTPYFIFSYTEPSYEDKKIIHCYVLPFDVMAITRVLMGFVVPFSVIVYCYAVIIHRLRRNRAVDSHSSRPFKITAAIIVTFFLCLTPFYIMDIIELGYYNGHFSNPVLDHVITIGVPLAISLTYVNSCLNPLLYVFMGQDFKYRVRKSILNVFESAFQEEASLSHPDTESVDTSQTRDKSFHNTEV